MLAANNGVMLGRPRDGLERVRYRLESVAGLGVAWIEFNLPLQTTVCVGLVTGHAGD
ncbi:MAG TPA: hypothetical protein PK967_12765 [Candidatus Hydrogenedentes bacterium]|nr:hypothetical protein [Candidatus Hydrogenedentota bacterium]